MHVRLLSVVMASSSASIGVQAVFRPNDCPLMHRAVTAVVSFVEEPSVGGHRTMPLDILTETLRERASSLPDIGVAPTALLTAALARPDQARMSFTPLLPWLSVRQGTTPITTSGYAG